METTALLERFAEIERQMRGAATTVARERGVPEEQIEGFVEFVRCRAAIDLERSDYGEITDWKSFARGVYITQRLFLRRGRW